MFVCCLDKNVPSPIPRRAIWKKQNVEIWILWPIYVCENWRAIFTWQPLSQTFIHPILLIKISVGQDNSWQGTKQTLLWDMLPYDVGHIWDSFRNGHNKHTGENATSFWRKKQHSHLYPVGDILARKPLKSVLYFCVYWKSFPLAHKSSQCSFTSSLLHWGIWWERFQQCPKVADLWEMTGHKSHFYYDLFEPASFLRWKFIWINGHLQSQPGTALAICEPEDTETGPFLHG